MPGPGNLTPVPNEDILPFAEDPSAQFVRLVASDTEESIPEFDMDTAIMLTRLIECAYESAREQKAVLY